MKRKILNKLMEWKSNKNRKPLILKGARQVGKTFLLQQLGSEYFPKSHYFNFEKNPEIASAFELNLDPKRIVNELSFFLGSSINAQQDLIIFDEIQACPKALTSLKYFQEEMPELALCAAGSLLGIHLNTESFPVGKVDFLSMYPMTFEEFLQGIDDEKSLTFIKNDRTQTEVPPLIHQHLWKQFKLYLVVGGLPEVVSLYDEYKDNLFEALTRARIKQNELINAYYADIAKHSGKVNAMHIDRVWRSIPRQLARTENGAANKFKFKDIVPGINRYSRLAGVIDWLDGAGLIIKVHIVQTAKSPLSAYTKENTFKLLMFDVGILGAMSDLSPKIILDYDYGSFKGYFAENYVAQELLAESNKPLYSWQEANEEVEFLCEMDGKILPIEVKSGQNRQAKSLKSFAEKYHPPSQIILSSNSYPLYLTSNILKSMVSNLS